MRQPAWLVLQNDIRKVLGRLADERSGVRIGHRGGLPTDRLGDALVAVAEAGDRRATRGVDHLGAVREVQVDTLPADRDGGDGAGTMQNAAHAETTFCGVILGVRCATFGSTSCANSRSDSCQAAALST